MIRGLELVVTGPFARATLTNFFFMSSLSCFILLPPYVQRLGGTEAEIGLVQGVYSAAGIVCQPVIGLWLDRVGRHFFMALGVCLLIISSAAFLISHSLALLVQPHMTVPVVPFLFLAGVLAGGAHGFLYPALAALLMDVTPEARRGGVVGIFSAVFLVGNALGSIVFGYVAHGLGYGVMWSTLTLPRAAGFLLSFRLGVGYAVRAPHAI